MTASAAPAGAACPLIRTDIPHSARVWNYWMGGKDYYDLDRISGDAATAVYPAITTMAVQSSQFLHRTVGYLAAGAGVRQFLDIGVGLPAAVNTHEIAQAVAPESKVVYVDNDPLVIAHARALLTSTTPDGATSCLEADFHDPEQILTRAADLLDFTRPIAVMFMGVLGHARSYIDMLWIVHTIMAAVPPGSYLLLWDGTDDCPEYTAMCQTYNTTGAVPYVPRSKGQLRAVFEGLDLVAPGFTSISRWRPNHTRIGEHRTLPAYGGLARKP
ncbi:SAM-dependent methyltransferase [Nocardia higoensis]|uniref:SAM-dependent methyltransferase n=1 Tax=Nocardia higoensis TaxID=228599 RepID=UPI0002E08A63|nr:SAM-dependent methyltransferase [Nocardia higoensis]